ncbi:MAG: inositol monophosphatase [Thermoanaerobaculales bacterium]|jgi:myo-inositol-1(or 4)-monophosphatase|nr:inositol monophosphatase [Thermoanaerobaculales bacterium]
MPFHRPADFLDQVEAVARAGAEALMPYWRSLEPDQVTEKARNDLVTAADRAAEAAILGEIGRRFPGHAVLAEESGWTRRGDGRPTWIVDPLDGTTNFVHGLAQFAVSIGVAVDGRVESAVVLDPVKNDLFRAGRGLGATWNGRPCRVSRRPGLAGALVATGFPFRAHELLDPYLGMFREVFLRCKAIRRPGAAALDLAYTACGIFDGFFELKLSPWDVAAGSLLVEEAGGVVSDLAGGGSFLASGDVLSGSPGVHAELLEVARSRPGLGRPAPSSEVG